MPSVGLELQDQESHALLSVPARHPDKGFIFNITTLLLPNIR